MRASSAGSIIHWPSSVRRAERRPLLIALNTVERVLPAHSEAWERVISGMCRTVGMETLRDTLTDIATKLERLCSGADRSALRGNIGASSSRAMMWCSRIVGSVGPFASGEAPEAIAQMQLAVPGAVGHSPEV